jgi:hypothetical protein
MGFALGGLLFGYDNNVSSGAVDSLVFPKAVKNLGASSEAFRSMLSQDQIKPKQASGYQTHSE